MEKPTKPCYCGSDNWWWRPAGGLGAPGGWLCGRCHPNPNEEVEVSTEKGDCEKHGEFVLTEGCPGCLAEKQGIPGVIINAPIKEQVYMAAKADQPEPAPEVAVISDQPGESHLAPVSSDKKDYSSETLALRDRVISGNKKLNDAWEQIRQIAPESQEWKDLFEQWGQANVKLSALCDELKLRGYEDCLYLDEEGKRTRSCLSSGDTGCRVCPSRIRYWEQEFDEL